MIVSGDDTGTERLDAFRELARRRRSVRAFRDDPIPEEVLRGVLEAANWAPSGANAQPWEFVVVRDEDRQRELAEIFKDETSYKRSVDPDFPAGGNYGEFVDAPVTVVVAGDTRYERWWPQILDGSREKLFHHSMAACIQTLHLAAAAAGLGTTWVTVRGPSVHRVRDLLDVPAYLRIGSVAPLGYPDWERNPRERSRVPLDHKRHEERIDEADLPSTEEIMAGKDDWIDRVYDTD